MSATDKMADAAIAAFDGNEDSLETGWRGAIKAAIEAAWVDFDVNNKETHPPLEEDVLVDFGGYCVVADLRDNYGLCWSDTGDIRFVSGAKRWMSLSAIMGE